MNSPGHRPNWKFRALAPRRLILACALLLLAGCVQDAETMIFVCSNPVDTAPHGNCDTTAASSGTGQVTIVSVNTGTPKSVVLVNSSATDPVTMTNWTIVNSAPTVLYTFPSYNLAAGGYVVVHTVAGTDTSSHLYGASFAWGSTTADNTATLRNDTAATVSTCSSTQITTCWQ